ncbi:hypothetical protein M426DRAFT_91016 [Hypoxylon sp. CI-4A]|nr:hypothetical protein M426DRAFT_91016 [Hypoxylon sp. CI-4A]
MAAPVQDDYSTCPPDFDRIHPLSIIDQSVRREYNYCMLIFDFPDTSDHIVAQAVNNIKHGLEAVFESYPFLTGRLGPSDDPDTPGLAQLRYSSMPSVRKVSSSNIFQHKVHEDGWGYNYEDMCKHGYPVSH